MAKVTNFTINDEERHTSKEFMSYEDIVRAGGMSPRQLYSIKCYAKTTLFSSYEKTLHPGERTRMFEGMIITSVIIDA